MVLLHIHMKHGNIVFIKNDKIKKCPKKAHFTYMNDVTDSSLAGTALPNGKSTD